MSLYLGYSQSKKITVPTQKKTPPPLPYETVFNVNVRDAKVIYQNPGSSIRVERIEDGRSRLHQNVYRESPTVDVGADFVKNLYDNRMVFDCPQLTRVNVSIFVVFKLLTAPSVDSYGYIVGNDNGSYDKFIGYKTGSNDQLSYGGGWPVKEYNCTLPSGVIRTNKHLISCHWMMKGSHVRVNNVKSSDSYFDANLKNIGAPFSSIFFNERLNSSDNSTTGISGEIYGLRVVSGFLEPADISKLNKSLMLEYGIDSK